MPAGQSFDSDTALRACRLFFLEDRTKQEIAEELGISRFKVARLIADARARGLVRIDIAEPDGHDPDLSARLERAMGLMDCLVTPSDADDPLAVVGPAAARLLAQRLRPGDAMGLGWGRSVLRVVQALDPARLPRPVDVVQLAGGVAGLDFSLNPIGLAALAAERLAARLYSLHAPAFVETDAARRVLLSEGSVAETLAMFDRVAVAVVGVGSWRGSVDSSLHSSHALPSRLLEQLQAQEVCGDAFCHFFDSSGRVLSPTAGLAMAPTLSQVRAIPLRIGVAAGTAKAEAIAAAVRSGLINALVTDTATAGALLRISETLL